MRRGFTLIEMLVVIGIIAILMTASLLSYNGIISAAQKSRAQELVHEVRTALVEVLQKEGAWPRPILAEGSSGKGEMNERVGGALAKRGAISLTYRKVENEKDGTTHYELSGPDKFGIVDPWAMDVIRKRLKGGSLSLTTKVPTGGTIQSHRLRFAVDDDGDGKVTVRDDAVAATIRASAAVWGAGRDGEFGTKDDLRSWAKGQEER